MKRTVIGFAPNNLSFMSVSLSQMWGMRKKKCSKNATFELQSGLEKEITHGNYL